MTKNFVKVQSGLQGKFAYVSTNVLQGPTINFVVCVPFLLQLPASHPNNCLQQTPRTIYYDTFLE